MFDWIIIAIGGGLLAAGCAAGSLVTKVLQRLLFTRKSKEAVKEAVNAQTGVDVEANRENQDGMEDLLFDEKLRLLVMGENLKKKLLQQKQIILQLMGGDKGQAAVSGAGDKNSDGSDGCSDGKPKSDRNTRSDAEVEYFASELELSKWQN